MNELTKFLVEGILNEETEKVVALFGGGFKPPTKGHLDVVNQGIKQNPEVTKIKILVGGGERNGFTQDQSVKIWNLYNDLNFIDKPATINSNQLKNLFNTAKKKRRILSEALFFNYHDRRCFTL